jgi:aryl-alcohol dehydrogenase-like predicted oxidoreductase
MGKRRQSSAEFKREAVALTAQPDVSVAQVARELGIDRRRFLALGAAASGFAIGCGSAGDRPPESDAPTGMQYRPLGDTGLNASVITFGSAGFENPALLEAALDAGINTISTGDNAAYGRADEIIGRVISSNQSRRDQLIVCSGILLRPGITKQRILEGIDRDLRSLRTDYVDVCRAGNLASPDDLRIDALYEAFEEARQAGKVTHLAAAGHSGIDDGRFKALFTKYDFVSYPDQDSILQRAADRGIGTVVFKVNAGNRQHEIRDLEAGGLSFRQATLKWALSHPYVASVCVGFTNFDQIREYTAAVGSQLTGAETAMLSRYANEMYHKYCRFCRTCEGNCPHSVAIADVMRYAMYFKYYGREKDSMAMYSALPGRHTASACDRWCTGHCDKGCPFGRRVRDELVEAHQLLSFTAA